MNSIRERLLREVLARLSVAVAPVPVLRYPTVPVTREASPALLMFGVVAVAAQGEKRGIEQLQRDLLKD